MRSSLSKIPIWDASNNLGGPTTHISIVLLSSTICSHCSLQLLATLPKVPLFIPNCHIVWVSHSCCCHCHCFSLMLLLRCLQFWNQLRSDHGRSHLSSVYCSNQWTPIRVPLFWSETGTKWWNDSVCFSIHTFIDYTGEIKIIAHNCIYDIIYVYQSKFIQFHHFHRKKFSHTCTFVKRLSQEQSFFFHFRFTGCASAAWSKAIRWHPRPK